MSRSSLSSIICFLLSAIPLFIFSGCADDLRHRSVFDAGAGDAVIRFSVEDVSLTRDGESEDIESVIDHAYLLFYAPDASLVADAPVAAVKAELDPAQTGNLKFKMPLSLLPNTDYQLIAIANADEYTPSGFENFGTYLESWCHISSSDKDPLYLYSSSRISPQVNTNLPMKGGVVGDVPFRFSFENGIYSIPSSLSFCRMVARVDVANIVKESFIVEGVALCNWRDAVPVSTFDSQLGNGFGALHATLPDESASFDEPFIEMPEADASGVQQLSKSLYCFPSVSYDAFLGDKVSTAIIIKAKYGEDSESSYYRVNVGIRANQSKVSPNTKYLVTIRSVKGRGASTPEEAYFASESQIVLSVVEGWDLEGNAYDMDEYGNFIVLSRGSLEFERNVTENQEVRVLTSKDIVWSAEYIADNDASSGAFNVSKVADNAIVIGPKSENEEDVPLTGKCCVSATTTQGTTLKVDISLCQTVAEEKPNDPVIPADMPFALVPDSYDRVKIDHEKRTIEIDGFDPNCFNSFIDIPFRLYINSSVTSETEITVDSDLEWPLEGCVSENTHNDQYYCMDSFTTSGTKAYSVYSATQKKDLTKFQVIGFNSAFSVVNDNVIYLSVGAMGPDDPSIERSIKLISNEETVIYKLTVKPTLCIIDDVIINVQNDDIWLIQDRNITDFIDINKTLYEPYIGFDANGKKRQAYNYSNFMNGKFYIPNKLKGDKSPFDEFFHAMYRGYECEYKANDDMANIKIRWLDYFIGSEGKTIGSPFFEDDCYDKWCFPSDIVMKEIRSRLKVSKFRMYLVSDVAAKKGRTYYPICCYLPYSMTAMGDTDGGTTSFYFVASSNGLPDSLGVFYIEDNKIKFIPPTSKGTFYCMSRLVRQLSNQELEDYKNNYLGYGSAALKLSICHPDTYGHPDWLPY